MIDIKDLDKAVVLSKLYNASKTLGLGFLQEVAEPMTIPEAREILKDNTQFDYLYGKVMKIDLTHDSFDPWLYDKDNGEGKADRIIQEIRNEC